MNRADDECYTGTGPAAEVANGWGKPRYSDVATHAGQADQGQPTYTELLAQRDELGALLRDARWRIANLVGPKGAAPIDRVTLDRIDAALSRIKGA